MDAARDSRIGGEEQDGELGSGTSGQVIIGSAVAKESAGEIQYTARGAVQAYVQFTQELADGVHRLSHWRKIPEAIFGTDDGINASDPEIVEIDGGTLLYFAVSDQLTWMNIKRAAYPGCAQPFFESWYVQPGMPDPRRASDRRMSYDAIGTCLTRRGLR